ncbi:MAG: AGE family epimerase/isomerase, partial [Pseudomonadota bacterium]
MRDALQTRVRAWLVEDALPLWRGVGVDDAPGGFGVFEALDHKGAPRADLPKRVRVQARQVFAFATASRRLGAGDMDLARRLFADTMRVAFDETDGRLAGSLDRGGRPLSTPHDLYDLAFMILADASLGGERGDALWSALEALKAEKGWFEAAARPTPRRQNPHMHLFEAALAQIEAGDARYAPVAEECLSLMREVFFDGGALLEFFDADWRP